jgi:L,D-transpeptidase ErfK/SrfK
MWGGSAMNVHFINLQKTYSLTKRSFRHCFIRVALTVLILFAGLINTAFALVYTLPPHDTVVGQITTTTAQHNDTLRTIGYRHDIGHREMVRANPHVHHENGLQRGTKIIIPARFILPSGPKKGIVINLAELRLYYYPSYTNQVMTFPIGIGKIGWETPIFEGKIIKKSKDPSWYVPESVKNYNLSKGIHLPDMMPPGPENPLGKYALYTSQAGYLIHGTNRPLGVGSRVSSGCIRLYPRDIETLYNTLGSGTKLRVIHRPFKVGRLNGELYLESHPPLQAYQTNAGSNISPLINAVLHQSNTPSYEIHWPSVEYIVHKSYGIPQRISTQ